jgi:hypothetical protein
VRFRVKGEEERLFYVDDHALGRCVNVALWSGRT